MSTGKTINKVNSRLSLAVLKDWFKAHGWRDLALPLLVYTLAVVFITWPLAMNLSTHVAGPETSDSVEYARLGWWAKYALQHGLNPFYQSLFGYPEGFFSATQWSQPLIYWPITLIGFVVDPIAAFNIRLMLEVILSGLTAYWLCREILGASTTATLAALFGGLVFIAFPATQSHLAAGHVNPLSNYALPVLVLCLYRIVEGRGGIRTALLGALAFLVLALGNFTFPVFALLPLVLFGGAYLLIFRRRQVLRRSLLRDMAVLFGVGLVLMVPFYIPLAQELSSPNRPAYLQESGWIHYSTDPLNFIALSPFTPWTAPIAPGFSGHVISLNSVEGVAYLGIVAVVLAAVAVVRQRKAAALWLVVALGSMLFSLGPVLKWNQEPVIYRLGEKRSDVVQADITESKVVLPWALFQNLPLISATRTPGRFNFMTGLALGVLAALGLDVILQRVSRVQLRPLVAGGLAVILLAEYQVVFPFPITPAAVALYFTELGGRTDKRAVFDVPLDDLLGQKTALLEQMAHQKALLAGYVSRRTSVDPVRLNLLEKVAIGQGSLLGDTPTPLDTEAVRSILRSNGADVVVYHWAMLDRQTVEPWAIQSLFLPAHRDQWTAIFEIPNAQKPFDGVAMAYSSLGWWRNGTSDPPWLKDSASIDVYTPKAVDRHWTIALAPILQSRRVALSVDGRLVHQWLVSTPNQQIDFWLRLEPGFHSLQFTLPDGCSPVQIQPACLLYDTANRNEKMCQLKADERDLCVGMAVNKVQAQESGAMAMQSRTVKLSDPGGNAEIDLRGYRMQSDAKAGQSLTIETDWQTPQKLGKDYHIFVHMLDQSGKLVAQYDGIPGGGLFPTTAWAAGQAWSEIVTISLPADLAAGHYDVYTGWYRYPEQTRLQVGADTPRAQDGLIYLNSVEIH